MVNRIPASGVHRTRLALILGCTLAGQATAQWCEHRYEADPSTGVALYGYVAAASGEYGVLGAHDSDLNGTGSGAAYIVSLDTAEQVHTLLGSDTDSGDQFGVSLGAGNGLAIIGAKSSGATGAAYVFEMATGTEILKIPAPVGASSFGLASATDGQFAAVSYKSGSQGRVQVLDIAQGHELFTLASGDPSFGHSVALSSSYILVGAPGYGGNDGRVYAYDLATGNLAMTYGGCCDSSFGRVLAANGDLMVVGAPGLSGPLWYQGSAFLADLSSGGGTIELLDPDPAEHSYFGEAVAIGDAYVAVFSRESPASAGAVYVYDRTGQFVQKVGSPGSGGMFGWGLAVSGYRVLAGAPYEGQGCAYRVCVGSDCNQNNTPDSEDIGSGTSSDCDANEVPDECQIADNPSLDCDGNGVLDSCESANDSSLDCDGDTILDVCQITNDPSLDCDGDLVLDSCQLFNDPSLDCDGDNVIDACQIAGDPSLDLNSNGILDSCECAFENYCFASGHSGGQSAVMGASGSASVSANNLTLTVSDAPALKFGLFFYGGDEDFFFAGEGAICVKPPLNRVYPVVLTDGSGSVSLALDLSSPPFSSGGGQIAPFETWYFQFWFRDPLGGPAGYNFSDGLAVTFCP